MEKNKKLIGLTRAHLQLREAEDKTPEIEGYAIVFEEESVPMWRMDGKDVVEVIDRDAITTSLLDASDIKMTMYHDDYRLLARSKKGSGSLAYEIDEKGVKFRFKVPDTPTGKEALELVRSGDIDGCSFAFWTDYGDTECVERQKLEDKLVFRVRKVFGVCDFTLTPDPAYPQTECEARHRSIDASESELVKYSDMTIADVDAKINEINFL